MAITVEFKDYNEMVAFARVLLAGPSVETKALVKDEAPSIKKPEPVKTESIPEPCSGTTDAPEETEAPVTEDPAPTYTLEQVRAKLTALTRAGKQKEVRGILDHFKVPNVTALDPSDYAAVMEKAGAL